LEKQVDTLLGSVLQYLDFEQIAMQRPTTNDQRPTTNDQRPRQLVRLGVIFVLVTFAAVFFSIAGKSSLETELDRTVEVQSVATATSNSSVTHPVVGARNNFLFDSSFDIREVKDFKIDFGSEVHEKRKGRIVLTRPSGVEVATIRTSCGCSVPINRRVGDESNEVIVEVRSARPSDIRSKLTVELTDGTSRVIQIAGSFVVGVAATPSIIALDADCSSRVVLDWSRTKLNNPRVFCNDDRFTTEVLESKESKIDFRLVAGEKMERKDFALLTDVMFTLADSERSYEIWLPVSRTRSGVVVPSSVFVDSPIDSEIKFFVVAEGQATVGRTGRCQLKQVSGDLILTGEVLRENPSSLVVSIKLIADSPKPSGATDFMLEMEFKSLEEIVWKDVGIVSIRFKTKDR